MATSPNDYKNFNKYNPKISEKYWQEFFRRDTCMGSLFTKNNLFSSIKENKNLTLVHVTTSLEQIEENGFLYASGGCLGASIYVVPLNPNGTIHNLTKFLLDYEVPNSLKAQKKENTKIDVLAIEIPSSIFNKTTRFTEYGFDYFSLGEMQAKIFKHVSDLNVFSKRDLKSLEVQITQQIQGTKHLLNICLGDVSSTDSSKFMPEFVSSIKLMPLLGYVYFEALAEYVSLMQNDKTALDYLKEGELYNGNFKRLVFDVSPNLLSAFKLVNFHPKFEDVVNYLENASKKHKIIIDFSAKEFLEFMKHRTAQYIRLKILGGCKLPKSIKLVDLYETNPTLLGHLFQKTIRNIPTLSQQHFLYEELRAEIIWNNWNRKNIICPFNSIIPKGEMGINPRYPLLDYRVFIGQVDPKTGKLHLGRKTTIRLAPKLINPGITLMRAPNKLPFNI